MVPPAAGRYRWTRTSAVSKPPESSFSFWRSASSLLGERAHAHPVHLAAGLLALGDLGLDAHQRQLGALRLGVLGVRKAPACTKYRKGSLPAPAGRGQVAQRIGRRRAAGDGGRFGRLVPGGLGRILACREPTFGGLGRAGVADGPPGARRPARAAAAWPGSCRTAARSGPSSGSCGTRPRPAPPSGWGPCSGRAPAPW
jgi:hypothetical protein